MVRLRIKEIAESKGIGMGRLSRLADLSYPTVRDVYRNPYHDLALSTLEKFAKALEVNICELIEVVDKKPV